jgi:SAM-dependent methyltransferase
MTSRSVSGTEGYAAEADALAKQYESITFAETHAPYLHLIPTAPSRVLDIGAGTGRDAAALAEMGHLVVAAEPTAEMRAHAARLHPSPRIEWVDDSLPDLAMLTARGETFDLVMMTAVWMHLDDEQRRRAMPSVARLVRPGGLLTMTLRYGPVPAGRRMFVVTADETIALAADANLAVTLRLDDQPGGFGRTDVSWTKLVFEKGEARRL